MGDLNNISFFPKFQELKEDLERLNQKLSDLFFERDQLVLVICKNIETAYLLEFGPLEYKAYEAECTAMRLKRKIHLIQTCINRQEPVDMDKIEEMLDQEFFQFQVKLEEEMNRINQALERSQLAPLSPEEIEELKSLYRKIMKALHPDLNPGITPAQISLFQKAVTAYEKGDLETLRIIDQIIDQNLDLDQKEDTIGQMVAEKARLEELIDIIVNDISQIKDKFPYIAKDIIESPDKIKERKEDLKSIIQYYRSLILSYKEEIENLMKVS